jgi:hypothetical protein
MSVMTVAIFWVGQRTPRNHFERADLNLASIPVAFLFSMLRGARPLALLGY